ncbi:MULTISPECIES: M3 family metallopeptidase [unclassified Pseudomonas]|uniref:M3 family metallopeptidase n=1 Tax=unclassified Pseudomonas TaxID=196821 RepID=UPI00119CE621|nr:MULTISPECIES: M3 family metallopeptidase [unclassified Pseudomonas]
MLEILSSLCKAYLLTTERSERYRQTYIKLRETDFSHIFAGGLQYPWPQQFPRQRET